MTAYPTSGDGNAAVVSFLITGFYPGALWMAYIFLGLGLSRLDWSRSRNLWRLAAVGALCAVIGYGAGWSVAGSSIRTSPTPTTWSPPRTPSSASTGRVGPRSESSAGRAGRRPCSTGYRATALGLGIGEHDGREGRDRRDGG